MWPRLIFGGFLAALGISLLISVCIAHISPRCVRFYGGLALALLVPGLVFFVNGFKEYAARMKRQ